MELREIVSPNSTALLVIDIQNAYCSSEAPLPKLQNFDTAPIDEMILRLEAFVDESRKHNVPVVWTRMIEDSRYAPQNLRIKMESEEWPVISTPGTLSFEYYKIRPQKGDKEIVKKQYDAFTNRGLQRYLRNNRIASLILTGVYTSRCVDSTMRSAFARGYHCIIPEDLVAVPTQLRNEHDATLSVCKTIFGYVVQSKDITNIWNSRRL